MIFTDKVIAALKPEAKRAKYSDGKQTGLMLRVEPNGRKGFFYICKASGKAYTKALGEYPQTSLPEARAAAADMFTKVADWRTRNYADPSPFAKVEKPKPVKPSDHILVKENHGDSAEYDVRWFAKSKFGAWTDRPIDTITAADVLTVKNAQGSHKVQANRCVEFVRRLFNWCSGSKDGKANFWNVANPAASISRTKETKRDRFLSAEELVRFEKALANEPHADLKLFLRLALDTGARKTDILSMRWQDIDWESQTWNVPRPKNRVPYLVQLSTLPKSLAALKARRREAPSDAKYVFAGEGRNGYVENVDAPWHLFRERAGIPTIHLHDLRRTTGSYAAMAGQSLPQIGAILGHASLQSTMIYARLADASVREARVAGQKKMAQLMAKAAKRHKSGLSVVA